MSEPQEPPPTKDAIRRICGVMQVAGEDIQDVSMVLRHILRDCLTATLTCPSCQADVELFPGDLKEKATRAAEKLRDAGYLDEKWIHEQAGLAGSRATDPVSEAMPKIASIIESEMRNAQTTS